jgi:hypothetical protein
MIKLLKALATGDTTGAKTDLAKLKTDLKAEEASTASSTSNKLTTDVTSLLKDLTSGNTSAAQKDVTQVQTDLQAQGASSSTKTPSALDTLVTKMSASLSSGNTDEAMQQLASYLVQNGQSTGSLVNTSA